MVRVIAVLFALACLSSGCATWQKSGAPAAIECAGDKLATRVALVVSVLVEVAKEPDEKVKQAKLAEVGKVVGFDVLACALQHVRLAGAAR